MPTNLFCSKCLYAVVWKAGLCINCYIRRKREYATDLDAATFERVRELLSQKVTARLVQVLPDEHISHMGLDPAYDGLRAVFREQVEEFPGSRLHTFSRLPYWQAADPRALEGALIKALIPATSPEVAPDVIDAINDLLGRSGDTRQAALDAVLRWLEGA